MRCLLLLLALLGTAGRHNRVLTDLGNGTAVPAASIQDDAQEHGIRNQEARVKMRAEMDGARAAGKTTGLENAAPEADVVVPPALHD